MCNLVCKVNKQSIKKLFWDTFATVISHTRLGLGIGLRASCEYI